MIFVSKSNNIKVQFFNFLFKFKKKKRKVTTDHCQLGPWVLNVKIFNFSLDLILPLHEITSGVAYFVCGGWGSEGMTAVRKLEC